MLKLLFEWLDRYPNTYWLLVTGTTLCLTVYVGILAWREWQLPMGSRQKAGWRDAWALALFIFSWRWPFLLVASEFNPDESQLIAGALTLSRNPIFWHAVDGTTSGPLNFYILLPLHWLGLPLDYFTARLTGLILVTGALFACFRTLARAYGRAVAWLGILPAAGFFATVTHPDLIHYSSEHLSLLLIATACCLLVGRSPNERLRLWTACALAGSAPWAKLQFTPLAFILVGWACWQAMQAPGIKLESRLRKMAATGLAATAPSIGAIILIISTGQAEAALRRYFLHNLIYVSQGNDRTMAQALIEMKTLAMVDGRFPLLVAISIGLIAVASIYFLIQRVRPSPLFALSGALTLAAIIAVITPRREFLHYVLLLPIPLALWLGATIGHWWLHLPSKPGRGVLVCLMLGLGLAAPLTRAFQPRPSIFGEFAYNWRHPRSPIAMVVHAVTNANDSLGIWGWAPQLYVESRLPQATRDPHSVWSILPNAQRDYHRACYLDDLRHNEPTIFIDAVGPGAFAWEHRSMQAHEIFPQLADYIRENYVLIKDLRQARVYARKGTAAATELTPMELDRLLARGRDPNRQNTIPPPITPIDALTRKSIAQRSVMMMLPPTLVQWDLDPDVREVVLEYGFDPEAYERGQSNGAEFILELVNPESSRQIFRRLLDPARQPADRGLQSTRIVLPPFSAGTHLVLRSAAGQHGDAAWDWLYLASVQFRRHSTFLSEQFPGFNRVPDAAEADNACVIEYPSGKLLHIHSPASLTYKLKGTERRLRFTYGILPGAYTDGGHTDGVVYRIELHADAQPSRVLFERHLKPAQNLADRGHQTHELILPSIQPSNRLLISIDPGPSGSAAWDWAYIQSFTLQ